jgi:hypothetical protein
MASRNSELVSIPTPVTFPARRRRRENTTSSSLGGGARTWIRSCGALSRRGGMNHRIIRLSRLPAVCPLELVRASPCHHACPRWLRHALAACLMRCRQTAYVAAAKLNRLKIASERRKLGLCAHDWRGDGNKIAIIIHPPRGFPSLFGLLLAFGCCRCAWS